MPKTLADHWIIRELSKAINDVEQQIESYRFAEASETVYHAVWDSVADWYIEASKRQDSPEMLAWVLDTCLKITHPFAPFVTETIWQTLSWHREMLITSRWPKKAKFDEIAAEEFNRLKDVITEARYVTNELPANKKYDLLYQDDALIADNAHFIQKMARLGSVQPTDQPRGLRLADSGRQAWLDISAEVLYDHQTNLELRLAETHRQIEALKARLSNPAYLEKAPANLVEETKSQLEQKQAQVERLIHELEVIKL